MSIPEVLITLLIPVLVFVVLRVVRLRKLNSKHQQAGKEWEEYKKAHPGSDED